MCPVEEEQLARSGPDSNFRWRIRCKKDSWSTRAPSSSDGIDALMGDILSFFIFEDNKNSLVFNSRVNKLWRTTAKLAIFLLVIYLFIFIIVKVVKVHNIDLIDAESIFNISEEKNICMYIRESH